MKLKIDEHLPAELAQALRADGHDAVTVADEGLAGSPDPPLLSAVQKEGRTLITMDKGIADVRAYPPSEYAGIILLRLKSTGRRAVLSFALRHLPSVLQGDVRGKLLVLSEAGVRSR